MKPGGSILMVGGGSGAVRTAGSMLQWWPSCSVLEAAMLYWLVLSHGPSCYQHPMLLSKPSYMAFLVVQRATPCVPNTIGNTYLPKSTKGFTFCVVLCCLCVTYTFCIHFAF